MLELARSLLFGHISQTNPSKGKECIQGRTNLASVNFVCVGEEVPRARVDVKGTLGYKPLILVIYTSGTYHFTRDFQQ